MVKIIEKKVTFFIVIILSLIFIALSACGKRGSLERPQIEDNLEPAEVEKNY